MHTHVDAPVCVFKLQTTTCWLPFRSRIACTDGMISPQKDGPRKEACADPGSGRGVSGAGNPGPLGARTLVRNVGCGLWESMNPWLCRLHTRGVGCSRRCARVGPLKQRCPLSGSKSNTGVLSPGALLGKARRQIRDLCNWWETGPCPLLKPVAVTLSAASSPFI